MASRKQPFTILCWYPLSKSFYILSLLSIFAVNVCYYLKHAKCVDVCFPYEGVLLDSYYSLVGIAILVLPYHGSVGLCQPHSLSKSNVKFERLKNIFFLKYMYKCMGWICVCRPVMVVQYPPLSFSRILLNGLLLDRDLASWLDWLDSKLHLLFSALSRSGVTGMSFCVWRFMKVLGICT